MGPLYITLHTSLKFNGIVSISYFAMVAVMLSGFFGRYIYMQIPRDEEGHVLSLQMALEREKQLERELRNNFGLSDEVLQQIFMRFPERSGQLQLGLWEMIWLDIVRPFRTHRLKKIIHKEAPELSGRAFSIVISTIKQRNLLMRRRAFSRTAHKIFHYWHVIHKPFAVVMIVFMFIHIVVTLMFGYGLQFR
ncbi:MAG: hypothetical protein Q9P14_10565 [candidate division KSB1 bacterium]|nr:hypothetical protein [candidate division KSB1 bacterium]